MSLVRELGVTLKDLLPTGQAFVLVLPDISATYQVSVRLHQALQIRANAEGADVESVFRRLIDEVNNITN